MKTVFQFGNIEIKRREGAGNCDYGHKLSRAAYLVERTGELVGIVGPKCKRKVQAAARWGTIDTLFGEQALADVASPPSTRTVREYDRYPATPENRREVLEAVLAMSRDEYLLVPKEVEIVPAEAENFRKKGRFIQARLPQSMEEIDVFELTPAQAALAAIADAPLGIYAGLAWMGKQLRTQRKFSLVSTIQGERVYNVLRFGAVPGRMEVEDYGSEVVFRAPSFTKEGTIYLGRVGKLPVDPNRPYSAAFEVTAQCSCPDSVYNNLPRSDANSGGKHYANQPIRPGKHESAVLRLLAERKGDLTVDPRPLHPSAELMEVQWKLANRVIHGSQMLTGQAQEVLLWGATNPAYLGVDRAFRAA